MYMVEKQKSGLSIPTPRRPPVGLPSTLGATGGTGELKSRLEGVPHSVGRAAGPESAGPALQAPSCLASPVIQLSLILPPWATAASATRPCCSLGSHLGPTKGSDHFCPHPWT